MIEIEVGQIWEVVDNNFFGSKDSPEALKTKRKARYHLEKGEKIEIRFPYKWNYRCEDDLYLSSSPKYILEKCKFIGIVKEGVRWSNKATLEEILRLDLYNEPKE
jgi:hypothetical protein